MQQAPPIVIAGAGIGGLACAIALANIAQTVHVLEQRRDFSENGAGIQIGPNGVHALRLLGVDQLLDPLVAEPDEIRIFDGISGQPVTALPLKGHTQTRFGAPYWVARRADLHAALLQKARADPRISMTTDREITNVEDRGNTVTVTDRRGKKTTGHALVGADGVWSAVAVRALSAPRPLFAAKIAARALVAAADCTAPFRDTITGLWMGPRSHLVHYPVAGGALINFVAVVEDTAGAPSRREAWSMPKSGADLAKQFAGWSPAVVRQLRGIEHWQAWPLVARAPLPAWSKGRVTLLGDAAHPVLPFLAQGGVLALEDALALAAAVQTSPGDLGQAFVAYERARKPRTTRVARASMANGRVYHLTGALAGARNLMLRAAPPDWLLRRYDWLYGYRPPE